ncbi:hypothetical protein HYDPIDRAFT_26750 [Hydnomerulius pinastri MD-312]|nr:hypothetical protein HYDPIDRAFT_26750 [Hydnomerulius pinastri MD-312]
MASDGSKIHSKLAKLNKSLDELESQLEPLLSQSLPETLLGLETIQQAKLQVVIPYVVYDLVFVYLKSRGIDPKTHPVVNELERIREYFDKIKNAEESDQKRKLGIDKAAAGRFIKHAIAQAKNIQLVDELSDSAAPVASSSSERVPVKVTSKMIERAEYEKNLKDLRSEEEEDLEVFDEDAAADEEDASVTEEPAARPPPLNKGKGRASDEEESSREYQTATSRRKRPRVDPFAGYEDVSSTPQGKEDHKKKSKTSAPVEPISTSNSTRGTSVSASEGAQQAKAAKKVERKAKKP